MNIEAKIGKILSKMSIHEKIGQLNQLSFDDIHNENFEEKIRNGEVGALILAWGAYAGNAEQGAIPIKRLNELQRIAVEESNSGIPLLMGRDVIHGHKVVFPIPLAMAASFNMEKVRLAYENIGSEATSEGIKWAFTPMLDLSRDPRWGRVAEGPGEDPYLGSEMAKAIVKGLQRENHKEKAAMAACAKHYIGYGASEGGRDYYRTEISDSTLRNYYLPAFRAAVNAGVATVMNSFNDICGQPVTSSKYLVNSLLKKELGFDGFVVSDYGATKQLERQGTAANERECAAHAIEAGIDMDMAVECYAKNLEELVLSERISEDTLDEAVRRVLRVKLRFGLFDNPYTEAQAADFEKHRENALKLASECVVLLKNEDGLLPLDKKKSVLLTGSMADEKKDHFGAWVIDGEADEIVSIHEAMSAAAGSALTFVSSRHINDVLISARNVDTVVVAIGESRRVSGEWRSLANIELSFEETELLKRLKYLGKKVIALVCAGRPLALEEAESYCDAVVYAWHLGTMAGEAISRVVYGDENPSGHLPISLPRRTGQIPIYYNSTPSGRPVDGYYENSFNYIDCKSTPLYPFGYGLSYSDFKIKSIIINEKTVSIKELEEGKKVTVDVNIENAGKTDGKHLLQCYIRDKVSSLMRPIKELVAFEKVFIKAGETRKVELKLDFNSFAYYNADKQYVVEKGDFEIYIGDSSYASLTENIELV
jgi:beta-glucosidase